MSAVSGKITPKFLWLTFLGLALGILEAIVVVYIRELYYPEGFHFPLKLLPPLLLVSEMVRELCTLLILFCIAFLVGKSNLERLSVFLFIFGTWDIFYYAGLKLFLNWPDSLFTWDILFLIPIIWLGPVLAPLICSSVMILIALYYDWHERIGTLKNLRFREWMLLVIGALVIYLCFTRDIGMMIIKGGYFPRLFSLAEDAAFQQELRLFIPGRFLWGWFTAGILLILSAAGMVYFRISKSRS